MSIDVFGAADDAPSLPDVRAGRAVLKKGMRGPSVRYAQGLLKVPETGEYDDKTFAAAKAFQKKVKIGVDGKIGKDTIRELELSAPLDLVSPTAAAAKVQAAAEAVRNAAKSAEAASTPAEKQAAEVEVATATLQARAAVEVTKKSPDPAEAARAEEVAKAAEDLARAKTPEERRRVIEGALDDPKPENIRFLSRKVGPVPYWTIGLGLAGATGLWLAKR